MFAGQANSHHQHAETWFAEQHHQVAPTAYVTTLQPHGTPFNLCETEIDHLRTETTLAGFDNAPSLAVRAAAR